MIREDEIERVCTRVADILAPNTALPGPIIQAAVRRALEEIVLKKRPPVVPKVPPKPRQIQAPQPSKPGQRQLELVYVHECRYHGCNSAACVLCKHNPAKRCTGNLAHKYWVGDKLLAKCEGNIMVELIDADTGARMTDEVQGMKIEVSVLDGNKYTTMCREAGEQCLEILEECRVLKNQRNDPLLVATNASNTPDNPTLVLRFPPGIPSVSLRDTKVTESSESVLAGTKRPPFRLYCNAVVPPGANIHVRPAVSEEFVVVTKRTKNLKKQEIPSLDDPISKLNHIGKETVKKLNELAASAAEASLHLPVPPDLHRITKVRQFQQLARMAEADGHLQQRIKQLLKLSKEKWDAACEHAKTAVQVDNRMRAWYQKDMSTGLLYICSLGEVRPDCPVALIENKSDGETDTMKVIPCEHQLPQQREQVAEIAEAAFECWWQEQHPGWMIFTLGNNHFESLDQIIKYSHGEGANIEGAIPIPKDNSAERTMSDDHQLGAREPEESPSSAQREAKLGSRDGLMRPPSGSMMPELAHSAGLSDQERMANLIRQCMAPLPTNGVSGLRDDARNGAAMLDPSDQLQFMAHRPYTGQTTAGLLHRPTPTTDPLGIVAALNWQMSQGGGSEGNGFPGQLGMLSGGLPLASLGSFGKLSGLPSLGTLGSLGRSSGTEAPRFGAPRMPEGAAFRDALHSKRQRVEANGSEGREQRDLDNVQ
ncbi:g6738 [Coccomyxa viridis]|uniref:G6738 protein n=1 Tax=Coccomyxa viridis TaxID=1274662 RepID=A0ABP1G117_9CHLO